MFTLEEYMLTGGFGAAVNCISKDHGWNIPVYNFGIRDMILQHGRHDLLLKDAGLTPEQIADKVLSYFDKQERN